MATMTIKNIPDELYARLKERAAANRRSVNSQAIVCLETALGDVRPSATARLARIDALRRRVALPALDEDLLRAAKDSGRP